MKAGAAALSLTHFTTNWRAPHSPCVVCFIERFTRALVFQSTFGKNGAGHPQILHASAAR
jgi:hypothetical protein